MSEGSASAASMMASRESSRESATEEGRSESGEAVLVGVVEAEAYVRRRGEEGRKAGASREKGDEGDEGEEEGVV
jgi:hypothetical protein